jgi:nucleotide-binding universal stress UspA family protein
MQTSTDAVRTITIKSSGFHLGGIGPWLQRSVFVLFTSTDRTLKALEKACELAQSLGCPVLVVAAVPVPFPLPLEDPPVPFDFIIRRFREQISRFPAMISIVAYLCRDRLTALKGILAHNAPIVIGVSKRWWPTRDERLAKKLIRAGYAVLLVETE